MPSARATLSARIRQEDAARTHEEWSKLDIVSIRLKCNEYNVVASGKKEALIDRLMEYFQDDDAQSSLPSLSESDQDGDEIALTIGATDEIPNIQDGGSTSTKTKRKKSGRQSSAPKIKDGGRNKVRDVNKQPSRPSHKRNRTSPPAKSATTPTSPVGPNSRNVNTISNQQQQPSLSELDGKMELIMQALHSTQKDINTIQTQQTAFEEHIELRLTNRKRVASPSGESSVIPTKKSNSDVVTNSPTHESGANADATTTTEDSPGAVENTGMLYSVHAQNLPGNTIPNDPNSNPWTYFNNPFVPPPLKETILKKIEDRTFVDFQDVHPDNQVASVSNSSQTQTIQIDQHSGLLSSKKNSVKKVVINSFPRWSSCFMIFAQAHLHYHPEDFFRLFQYHAIMIEIFNTYKAEACVKYDADTRMCIANQRKLPPERQTVFWTEINQPLKNRILSNCDLSKCDHCKGTGHHASNCHQKIEEESRSLPHQIAAAITEVLPHRQQTYNQTHNQTQQYNQQHIPNYQNFRNRQHQSGGHTNASNSASNYSNTNFNYAPTHTQTSQTNGNAIPAHQKPCRRFNSNTPCSKPPCQFLHACSQCGLSNHNITNCFRTTSTNFIPLKHWGYGPIYGSASYKTLYH